MLRKNQNLLASILATVALFATAEAIAASDDGSFNRIGQSYAASSQHKWDNTVMPEASGDFIATKTGASGDDQFMRQIAYYTRDMLDRGGWVNAFVSAPHYAVGNALLATVVGGGVTTITPA